MWSVWLQMDKFRNVIQKWHHHVSVSFLRFYSTGLLIKQFDSAMQTEAQAIWA